MEKTTKKNRELARKNGIDARLISVYTKRKGYGRQGVYVNFNEYSYGDIDDLYICDVFPNIDEYFENYDESNERKRSHEELIIEEYADEIAEYLENIEVPDEE